MQTHPPLQEFPSSLQLQFVLNPQIQTIQFLIIGFRRSWCRWLLQGQCTRSSRREGGGERGGR